MGSSGFISVIFFLMASSFRKPLMADPRANIAAFVCNSFSVPFNDFYVGWLIGAMSNLSNLIGQNGFGTTIVGEGPDAVYALAQCYKDLNSTDCKLCFAEIRSVLTSCKGTRGGRLVLDGCFGRYDNFSFFQQGVDSVVIKNCSSSKNNTQPDKFGTMLRNVIDDVSLRAPKSKGFAVGLDSDSNFSVYALAQCWDSLDERTCNSCIQAAASLIITCSPAIEGRSLFAGCYMRYSMAMFWNTNQKIENSSGKENPCIILGLVLGGCLLLTGIGLWIVTSFFGRSYDSYGTGLSAAILRSKLNFKYGELQRATQNFDPPNKLGQGGYGSVYKGILPDGREVAVKRLFLNTALCADLIINEVAVINQVRHRNLVKLLGCSVDGPESLLVYEYFCNRSLDHFVFDESGAMVLDWRQRFDIIRGVAEVISYLHHESEPRIIHRDIKASNILLDDSLKPKITDFGLARVFTEDQTHFSTGIAGTPGYMAPEYAIHGHLTEKADVYCFGILILEILTAQKCCNGIDVKRGQHFLAKIWSHYKAKTIKSIIDARIHDATVEDEIIRVFHVGLLCIQATPRYRPTMVKVVELLRNDWDKKEIVLTDPPYFDYLAALEEGESSSMLSVASALSLSGSSKGLMNGTGR